MTGEAITSEDKLNTAEELGLPQLVALLFCEYGNITVDGKANLSGIFDRIQPLSKDEKKQVAFYLFVRTAHTEGPVHLRVFDPDGKITVGIEFQGDKPDLPGGEPWHVQLLVPTAFQVRSEGTYWAEVSYKGKALGRAGLYIALPKEETENVNRNNIKPSDQIQSV